MSLTKAPQGPILPIAYLGPRDYILDKARVNSQNYPMDNGEKYNNFDWKIWLCSSFEWATHHRACARKTQGRTVALQCEAHKIAKYILT